MAKVTKVVDGETITYTETATTLVDDFVAGLASPFKVFQSAPTEFLSPRAAGIGAITYGVAGWLGSEFMQSKGSGPVFIGR